MSLGDGEDDGLTRKISALQKVLISGGYLNIIKPTGYYGKLTMAAVKHWQQANNLTATGEIGAGDRAILCGPTDSTQQAPFISSVAHVDESLYYRITGKKLAGSKVYFNGQPVFTAHADDLMVNFQIPQPEISGAYPVYVINSIGQSNTVYLTIGNNNQPAITGVNYSTSESKIVQGTNINQVTWQTQGDVPKVDVLVCTVGTVGTTENCFYAYQNVANTGQANQVRVGTNIPIGSNACVKVRKTGDNSVSSIGLALNVVTGSITQPSITVLSPNGGESYKIGDTITAIWRGQNLPWNDLLTVYLYSPTLGHVSGYTFTTPAVNNGSYDFPLSTNLTPGSYKVNVCDNALSPVGLPGKSLCDISDNYFTITSNNSTQAPVINSVTYVSGKNVATIAGERLQNVRVYFNNVLISKENHTFWTDKQLSFILPTYQPGTYAVYVQSPDYKSNTVYLTIANTDQTTCQNLYWHDAIHTTCVPRRFCGAYMYQGLKTFNTLVRCQADVANPTTTSQAKIDQLASALESLQKLINAYR